MNELRSERKVSDECKNDKALLRYFVVCFLMVCWFLTVRSKSQHCLFGVSKSIPKTYFNYADKITNRPHKPDMLRLAVSRSLLISLWKYLLFVFLKFVLAENSLLIMVFYLCYLKRQLITSFNSQTKTHISPCCNFLLLRKYEKKKRLVIIFISIFSAG